MNRIYEAIGTKKQSFHQMLKRKNYKKEEEMQLLYLVAQIRKNHPRMSAREIYFKLQPEYIGRDKFEQLCFSNGLKLVQKKNFRKTTDSTGVTRFPNLIKQVEVTGVNQVFVSDITYYEINGEFYYISLIMDLFNRELVGYSASNSLRTEYTTLPALQRLIYNRGSSNLQGAIIHSDGGGQYYCKDFLELTGKLKMLNSMTEESVFENAHAERLNGVIKNNYLYPYGPTDLKTLRKALEKAVKMYNTEKAHRALEGMTPVQYRVIHSAEKENNSLSNYTFSTEKNKYFNNKKLSNLVNTI